MSPRTLAQWLRWQETLNPAEIELGLDRIRLVYDRLPVTPPQGHVFVVAGTNGKGTCCSFLSDVLQSAGLRVGAYSSPHLIRYNERIRVSAREIADADLVRMFELVEAARHDVPLTYFEFGTLAALVYFSHMDCDAWVLEVGLGGRLDAVNLVDADFSVVTTVDLDHQQWLGDSIDAIAAEKAGIIKAESTAFYGDQPVPPPIRTQARRLKAPLICLNEQYSYTQQDSSWSWQGIATQLDDIPLPPGGGAEQLRNISLGLAVIEHYNADLLERTPLRAIIEKLQLPGRFQIVQREVEWVLDVAHNRQAARALRDKLRLLPARGGPTTVVVGMLADKQASEFAAQLADIADQWIACPTGGNRGAAANDLATRIGMTAAHPVRIAESVEEGLELACEITPENGRIVVCGSFLVVGPALEWLGLY